MQRVRNAVTAPDSKPNGRPATIKTQLERDIGRTASGLSNCIINERGEEMRNVIFTINVLLLTVGSLGPTNTAAAQVDNTFSPTKVMRRIAIGPPVNNACCCPTCRPFAKLEEGIDGSSSLVVSSIDSPTGLRRGSELTITMRDQQRPVDLMFSNIVRPGSLLVLDSARRIQVFRLQFDAQTGTPSLDGDPVVLGTFGSDRNGASTAFAEAPNAADPTTAYLAIGTRTGDIIAILIGDRVIEPADFPISSSPIDDLAVVPQVGYFAFAAATGGRLVGVDPDANQRLSGPQPEVKFSYGGSQWGGIRSVGAAALAVDATPLTEPTPVRIVGANGTTEVRIVEIPANPSLNGLLKLTEGVNRVVVDVVQLDMGSLFMLSSDGASVFYQPHFTLDAGFSGPLMTVAGATLNFAPQTLNLRSGGQFVTVTIEEENNNAGQIDASSLLLGVPPVAGGVEVVTGHPVQVDDSDGNGIEDLTVKFDRRAVCDLLRQSTTDTPLIRIGWLAADGTRHIGTARIRIKR